MHQAEINRHAVPRAISDFDQNKFLKFGLNDKSYCEKLKGKEFVWEVASGKEAESDGYNWTHTCMLKSAFKANSVLALDASCVGSPTGTSPLCGSRSTYYLSHHHHHCTRKTSGGGGGRGTAAHNQTHNLTIDVTDKLRDPEYLKVRMSVPKAPHGGKAKYFLFPAPDTMDTQVLPLIIIFEVLDNVFPYHLLKQFQPIIIL